MMGDRQPRPLIVPGHGADPPARRRQDELRGDHAHGLEGHAPHGAGLGVGAEPVRHIAENLGVFREFHFVEARQLAGIDRRLAWGDELRDRGDLGCGKNATIGLHGSQISPLEKIPDEFGRNCRCGGDTGTGRAQR